MLTVQSKVHVERISGMSIFNFLIDPGDDEYRKWWPGTHLEFHTLKHCPGNVGDVVYMDEYVGRRRVRMTGIVTEAEPGKKITWRLRMLFRLPVWLSVEFEDDSTGVAITHTITAGFRVPGRLLDGVFRLYFSNTFAQAMDEHVHIEFPRLGEILRAQGGCR